MTAKHLQFGKKGEAIAVSFLKNKGYTILKRNWQIDKAEVDIIAEIDDTIVFVEVKARHGKSFGNPEDAVSPAKQTLLLEAADDYMNLYDKDNELRFDIISITFDGNREEILHIEDAILPFDDWEPQMILTFVLK